MQTEQSSEAEVLEMLRFANTELSGDAIHSFGRQCYGVGRSRMETARAIDNLVIAGCLSHRFDPEIDTTGMGLERYKFRLFMLTDTGRARTTGELEARGADVETLCALCDWLDIRAGSLFTLSGDAAPAPVTLATVAGDVARMLRSCPGFEPETAESIAHLVARCAETRAR